MIARAFSAYLPDRESPVTQGILLGGFTLLVCLLIGGCWWLTVDSIRLRAREDTQNLLSQVLPAERYDNILADAEYTLTLDGKPQHFFLATHQGQPAGIVLFSATQGYGGPINLLTGIDAQGTVTGVRVISHKETPGLGDAIELARSHWILSFDGKSLTTLTPAEWHVKKDGGQFDAFTGATITPRAVVRGVHENLLMFSQNRPSLLNPPKEKNHE